MASFYDNASIITIPSGYKVGTLYSAKPTDGTGDMTFTRTGDTATRVNSAGIIERCITNFFLRSNDFSQAIWTKPNVTIGTGVTDPNGGTTAFSLAGSSSTLNEKSLGQTPLPSSTDVKSVSIYAKANTHSFIQVRTGNTNYHVNFDLTNGTFSAGANAKGTMTNLGGGWYRCEMNAISAGGSTSAVILLVDSLSATFNEASTTTNSVYIWRAQAQLGDQATNYIPTTTAAVTEGPVTNLPRLDYLGSTCPQLLMEPTRTNLQTYSQMFDISTWTKSESSVSGNVAVSPDGYTNADKLIDNSINNRHQISRSITPTTNTTYTFSCFVKKAELDYVILSSGGSALTGGGGSGADRIASVNLNNGSIVTNNYNIQSVNYGNGWYRISINLTTDSDGGTFNPYITTSLNGTSAAYIGSGQGIFIYGAQVEAGAYATSYIPTTSATVTRNNDACTKTGISALLGQTEGTFFIDTFGGAVSNTANSDILLVSDGSVNNRFRILTATSNRLRFLAQLNGNVTALDYTYPTQYTGAARLKIAIAYKNNDSVIYLNGVSIFSSSNAIVISNNLSQLTLTNTVETQDFNQVLAFKTRLTNNELATLTTL